MTIEFLYKYGSFGKFAERVIKDNTIWFSSPADLNDPFECRPYLDMKGSRENIIATLQRALARNNPLLPKNEISAIASSIYLERRLDDPRAVARFKSDIELFTTRRIGLYCLSSKPNDILMWSHYGKDHSGYCLIFEATDHTFFFGEAQEVQYKYEYPEINYFDTPNDEQLDKTFLTKYDGWSYEKEWRIISYKEGPGERRFPAELLIGVIFGLKTTHNNKQIVRSWLKERGENIQYFQARMGERKYEIEIEKIE